MTSRSERHVELRAEMAELLWEVAPPDSSAKVKNLLADINVLALLTLTLSAAVFLCGLHKPLVLSASIVGLAFSVLLLVMDKLSLSKNVARISSVLEKLLNSQKT